MITLKYKIPFIALLLFVLTAGLYLYTLPDKDLADPQPQQKILESIETFVKPEEPDPFDNLTIPYLRKQEFNSQLVELNLAAENTAYSSFMTSYSSDGNRINGLLTRPTGDTPAQGWPAIVFVHGYIPPTLYTTTGYYVDYVDYLARNGFVVFKIDLRGHASSEGEPGGGYYSSDYIVDVLNAYSALQNTSFVNPDKIGLWGHSMAGNVLLRTVAVKQTIPVAVIWAGAGFTYADLQEYGIDDNSYRPPSQDSERQRKRQLLFEKHGTFDSTSNFWSKVVPTNYLEGVTTAIQLNHAIDDTVVSIEYSRNLASILEDSEFEYELKEYSSGGHNISGENFTAAMQNTVDFFKMKLQ